MDKYKLVFTGELAKGKTADQVRLTAIKVLQLSEKSAERFFHGGNSVVVKKTSSLEQANVLVEKFYQLGLVLNIEKLDSSPQEVDKKAPPALMLEPIEPSSARSVEPIDIGSHKQLGTIRNTATEAFSQAENRYRNESGVNYFLVTVMGVSTLLLFFGLALLVIYSPHTDGFLRRGFIAGAVIMSIGYKGFKPCFNRLLN